MGEQRICTRSASNPYSPVTDADFEQFHTLVGDAPVLESADADTISNYKQNLVDARTILMNLMVLMWRTKVMPMEKEDGK